MRIARKKRRSGHDLTGLAVAALDHLEIEPRSLDLWPAAVVSMASIVVTSASPTPSTGITHERMAAPFRWTVQAPHSAIPQPNLVPVMPSTSRRTHSSGVSPSTST